jgi:hypothetical protein
MEKGPIIYAMLIRPDFPEAKPSYTYSMYPSDLDIYKWSTSILSVE